MNDKDKHIVGACDDVLLQMNCERFFFDKIKHDKAEITIQFDFIQ
jgi:hypothetical protein